MIAFTMLKAKIIQTPILKHFDPDRTPVIVVYASKWAVSAALLQNYDGVYWPGTFTSRTLKPNEINYGMVERKSICPTPYSRYMLLHAGLAKKLRSLHATRRLP